jgi:hypothetical protein
MNEQQIRLAQMAGIVLKESDYQEEPGTNTPSDQPDITSSEIPEEQTPADRLSSALAVIPSLDELEDCDAEIEALCIAAEALASKCAPQEDAGESSELTEGASSYMFSKKSKELFDIDKDTYIMVKADSQIQAVIQAKEQFKKNGYTGKIHLVS